MGREDSVEEQREILERIDAAVERRMTAKQMLCMAKRTAKAVVVRVVEKTRSLREAQPAREAILRDLEEFDRDLRKLDPPADDDTRSGKPAPKRKRGGVRVNWSRYIPGRSQSDDDALTS